MPELPEVETVRRGLNQVTLAQPIRDGEILLDRSIAHPHPGSFLAALVGLSIQQWHRRGKYLLAELSQPAKSDEPVKAGAGWQSGGWLGVHLRMTGQLLWMSQSEPVQKHCRVRLSFPNGQELRFVDQRTFGQLWYVPSGIPPEQVMSGLMRLGPEPFSPEFSVAYLCQCLQGRQRAIKTALLDQALVAGVGNIYADEALFLSGIAPQTLSSQLDVTQVERLHGSVLKVLQDSIDARGTTFSDFRNVSGINGNYGHIAWVYNRRGEPCRVCETVIQRTKLAGRSAHFCPRCQT
ncbi:MAG: DNA-formamidopyrimidine glycosylase [Pegethrix bostrychoides GSE-TBD4-15B]|jgi:formamidopyrimidine-DNA glycosylase|uniref:Formamidopyrimidine-DNA glycosylase n=1 Tax=Pegethrix bostrychoides GSE-TBD4-15B TaxID=2839662 RepID=A0A951U4V0_9CYAN|nr:DNA-formamidopyrimidine glycosylase [Pegethrix bostrychoides GSE-TBD4-15B]